MPDPAWEEGELGGEYFTEAEPSDIHSATPG